MDIKIYYKGQLSMYVDSSIENISLESPISLLDLIRNLSAKKDSEFGNLIFDSQNKLRGSLMIAINNNQVVELSETIIDKDCEITLLPPIAGG